MSFAERVTARNQSHGFFVIHGHSSKCLPDVFGSQNRIRISIGPFRIYINESHLICGQRILQIPIFVSLIRQPFLFRPPINEVGFPLILTAARVTKSFKTHRFQSHIAGQNHQVGPRDAFPILLLDRPKQTPGFIKIRIVGPAVEGFKPLLAAAGTTATVCNPVGSRTVPGHANEKWCVGAVIGRPPVL